MVVPYRRLRTHPPDKGGKGGSPGVSPSHLRTGAGNVRLDYRVKPDNDDGGRWVGGIGGNGKQKTRRMRAGFWDLPVGTLVFFDEAGLPCIGASGQGFAFGFGQPTLSLAKRRPPTAIAIGTFGKGYAPGTTEAVFDTAFA